VERVLPEGRLAVLNRPAEPLEGAGIKAVASLEISCIADRLSIQIDPLVIGVEGADSTLQIGNRGQIYPARIVEASWEDGYRDKVILGPQWFERIRGAGAERLRWTHHRVEDDPVTHRPWRRKTTLEWDLTCAGAWMERLEDVCQISAPGVWRSLPEASLSWEPPFREIADCAGQPCLEVAFSWATNRSEVLPDSWVLVDAETGKTCPAEAEPATSWLPRWEDDRWQAEPVPEGEELPIHLQVDIQDRRVLVPETGCDVAPSFDLAIDAESGPVEVLTWGQIVDPAADRLPSGVRVGSVLLAGPDPTAGFEGWTVDLPGGGSLRLYQRYRSSEVLDGRLHPRMCDSVVVVGRKVAAIRGRRLYPNPPLVLGGTVYWGLPGCVNESGDCGSPALVIPTNP